MAHVARGMAACATVKASYAHDWYARRDKPIARNSELALRRSEALATAIFNASTDAVCLLNDGVILDCNASALPLFGFKSREEIVGKSVLEFSPEYQADGSVTVTKLSTVIAKFEHDGQARFEWTHVKPDGTVFEVDVSLSGL